MHFLIGAVLFDFYTDVWSCLYTAYHDLIFLQRIFMIMSADDDCMSRLQSLLLNSSVNFSPC